MKQEFSIEGNDLYGVLLKHSQGYVITPILIKP